MKCKIYSVYCHRKQRKAPNAHICYARHCKCLASVHGKYLEWWIYYQYQVNSLLQLFLQERILAYIHIYMIMSSLTLSQEITFPWESEFPAILDFLSRRSVTDPRDGRKVALKKMPNVFQNLVSCKRVFRELRMLCFFKHDNVMSRQRAHEITDDSYVQVERTKCFSVRAGFVGSGHFAAATNRLLWGDVSFTNIYMTKQWIRSQNQTLVHSSFD